MGAESTRSQSMSSEAKLTSAPGAHSKDESPEGLKKQAVAAFQGGYKSEDIYEYIRGRGRGKYVCKTCGIRCKKPSMLKKHLRTHTDFRPYHCRHCKFSFKTKGNLTKHMKSKVRHAKKVMSVRVCSVLFARQGVTLYKEYLQIYNSTFPSNLVKKLKKEIK